MPRPHHRLNLYAVPADPDHVPPDPKGSLAWEEMVHQGIICDSGVAGPQAHLLVPGGFGRLRIDAPGGRTVFANRIGGFSVSCVSCGVGLARQLSDTITRWRGGGAGRLECPKCGAATELPNVETRPEIALGSFALEVRDVQSLDLTEAGTEMVRGILCADFRLVLSRG